MIRRFLITTIVVVSTAVGLIWLADRHRANEAAEIQEAWESLEVETVGPFGKTSRLEILPLLNWHAPSGEFRTEPGVSYRIETDDTSILFDVGFNRHEESPSPLEHNMANLGVAMDQIDAVFLSHTHRDHVGGARWEAEETFSIGNTQVDLGQTKIFSPTTIHYPETTVEVIRGPRSMMRGIASTGPIARRLFIGKIEEQALVIHVAGKGLVVIVGCGHQTTAKLLQRLEDAFDEPLYAIVGDLHYPLPEGRLKIFGLDAQRRLASGEGFFNPLTRLQLESDFSLLDKKSLGLIALGGHDTSDEVLDEFATRFGDRFQRIEIGRPIVISEHD